MSDNNFRVTRRGALAGAAGAAFAAALGGRIAPASAAAPMQGPLRPTLYRFMLGEFEVTTIFDGAVQLDGPHPIFGNNQPVEEVQQYAAAHALPTSRHEISFTPTIVNTGKELLMFDSGNGAARREAGAGKLYSLLSAAGYRPEQVDILAVTHGHGDHIGGLMEDGRPAFPNARYVVGRVESDYWSDVDQLPDARKANGQLWIANVGVHQDKTTFIKNDDEVVAGIRAVETFGHTPGHLSFHIESGGKRLLLWGDISNHYILSVQKPEWHFSFDVIKDAAVATRKRVFDMVATDQIPVIGYHMPPPAVGFLEKAGDGYRWVQASYQLHL